MWGSWYWPRYLIVVSLGFLIPEIYAAVTNLKNSLSDYAWNELQVSLSYGRGVHTVAWWVSLITFIVVIISLIIHIWFRGPV